MSNITVLDWLINKPVSIKITKEIPYKKNTYIVYKDSEGKEYVWLMLWYQTTSEKKWTYIRTLSWREKERFYENKDKAKEYFSTFSSKFKNEFPTSVPITARISLHWNHIYFYFFAEQRFDFAWFVRELRGDIPMRFFIYQVWARDRIRLHEWIHERYDSNWLPLMYSIFKHPLDQVESNVILEQWLRWRSSERLKDRSWKFDHTLNFEQYIYQEEIPKYPQKWSITTFEWKKVRCNWYNILTQEIKFRWEDSSNKWEFTWEFITTTLEEREKSNNSPVSKATENNWSRKITKRNKKPTQNRTSTNKRAKSEKWSNHKKTLIKTSEKKKYKVKR